MFGKKKAAPKKGSHAKNTPQNGGRAGAPQAVRGSVGKSVPTGAPANRAGTAPHAPAQRKTAPNNARNGLLKSGGKAPAQRKTAPNNERNGLLKNGGKVPANAPAQRKTAPNNAQNGLPKNGGKTPANAPKPVPEQARRAADKAALAKTRTEQQKRPYRGGNYTLYFILAAIVVGIVLAVLSNTVLFKCGTIEVTGTTRYSADEIISSAGIKIGDNLLHINAEKAAENVMNTFAFVDNAEVKKYYPTKIVVEITEAVNWFALVQDGKTNVISRGGKILGSIPADGLVTVKGYEAKSLDVGSKLSSNVDAKNKIVAQIFDTAEKVGLEKMTEIDLTDRFSLKVTVDNRIILNLGASTQLESKLLVAQALIEKKEIGEDERVSVLLTNPEKPAVENLQQVHKPVSSSSDKLSSDNSAVSSDNPTEIPPENPQIEQEPT